MYKSAIIIISIITSISTNHAIGQATATYDISFNSIWNGTDHTSIPSGAHWSKLVGATHKTPNTFLEIGTLSSTGIKNIAETGNNTVFNSEVTTEITNGEADRYINGPNLGTATGNMVISDLVVSRDFPLVTLISMIAPSPDWMIALNGYSLLDAGDNWITSASIDMYAYDAGTDSGADYTSANSITNPVQPITMINGAPINGNKIGTITITLKALSLEDNQSFEEIKIYPNPAKNGSISIGNIDQASLNKIEIFNAAGSQMDVIQDFSTSNTIRINIEDYPSGIYLMRLTDESNYFSSKKFMVE